MSDTERIEIVKNDRMPTQYFQLIELFGNTVLDVSLSTTVITGLFRSKGNTEASIFQETLTKVISELGIVSMDWPASALDQDVGSYELELTVTYDDLPQTVLDIVRYKLKDEFPAVA